MNTPNAPQDPKKIRTVHAILESCSNPERPAIASIVECLKSLQAQALGLHRNQEALQKQNQGIAKHIDRVTEQLFDSSTGDGGAQDGALTTLAKLTDMVTELEKRSSAYTLFSVASVHFLRDDLPRLVAKLGRFPGPEECEEAMNSRIQSIHQAGEEAAKKRAQIKVSVERMLACRFCRNWCASRLVIAGQDQVEKCSQAHVQLACPRCLQVYVQPVDPMDVPADARCAECQTPLQREVTNESGEVHTLCQLFDLDTDKARAQLASEGVPEEHIDGVFPRKADPIENNIGNTPPIDIGTVEPPRS